MDKCPNCDEYMVSKEDFKGMTYTVSKKCPYCQKEITKSFASLLPTGLLTIGFQMFFKMGVNIYIAGLLASIMIILAYFLTRYMPMKVSDNLSRQKALSVTFTIILIVANITITASQFNFVTRKYVAEDFSEINMMTRDYEKDLLAYKKGDLSEQGLYETTVKFRLDQIIETSGNINYRGLETYTHSHLWSGISEVIEHYLANDEFTEADIDYLESYIDIQKKYTELQNQNIYALSLNVFEDLAIPEPLKAYINELDIINKQIIN